MKGYFEGKVITEWLKDRGHQDRTMKLVQGFTFIDPAGKRWHAKAGSLVDGASIPAVLWNAVVGTPFVGDYRRATVLHDVACVEKIEPPSVVHKMFYEAMLCDGVSKSKAKRMYIAVKNFGPKWGDEANQDETPHAPEDIYSFSPDFSTEANSYSLDSYTYALDKAIDELGDEVSIEEIEQYVEKMLSDTK